MMFVASYGNCWACWSYVNNIHECSIYAWPQSISQVCVTCGPRHKALSTSSLKPTILHFSASQQLGSWGQTDVDDDDDDHDHGSPFPSSVRQCQEIFSLQMEKLGNSGRVLKIDVDNSLPYVNLGLRWPEHGLSHVHMSRAILSRGNVIFPWALVFPTRTMRWGWICVHHTCIILVHLSWPEAYWARKISWLTLTRTSMKDGSDKPGLHGQLCNLWESSSLTRGKGTRV